jgi:hypothetical protein
MFGLKDAAAELGNSITEAAEILGGGMNGAADRLVNGSVILAFAGVTFGLLVSRSPPVEAFVGGVFSWLGCPFARVVLVLVGIVVMAVVLVLSFAPLAEAASMISGVCLYRRL